MKNKTSLTAEELWQKITTCQTIHEWMDLTNGFSLYTIYHHCRILQDQKKIETYHCRISQTYPLSLEAFDRHDSSAVCYMMLDDGNLRRSCNPTFFDLLLAEGVRSAANDGPYSAEELDGMPTEDKSDDVPGVVLIAGVLELLQLLKVDAAHYDKSKLIAIIVMMTGLKESYVRRKIYEGFALTERHLPYIERLNQLFKDVNLPITLKVGNIY